MHLLVVPHGQTKFTSFSYKDAEGWVGGVWHWIFLSHEFQQMFSFKTVSEALDHDLDLYSDLYGATCPLFVRM